MGMPVVIVPGFMGSGLDESPLDAASRTIWADRSILQVHALDLMQLDTSGINPGTLAGKPLVPFGLTIPGIYEPLYDRLAGQGFSPEYFTWDWRKDLRPAGLRLATRLLQLHEVSAYSVICHSAGAIVTLLAWAECVRRGKTGSMRRVLWLAPDFGGSYAAAIGLAGGLFDSYGWGVASAFMGITARRVRRPFASPSSQATRLRQAVASWPGAIQLLPSVSGRYAGLDSSAGDFYHAGNWTQSNPYIRQTDLDTARTVQDEVEAALGGMLPPSVLVLSDPKSTPVGVRDFLPFDDPGSYVWATEGDGVVAYVRSAMPGVHAATIDPDHTSLPSTPGLGLNAPLWLTAGLPGDVMVPPLPIPVGPPLDPGGIKPPVGIDFPGLIRRGDP